MVILSIQATAVDRCGYRTVKQFFILKNDSDAEIRQEKLLETCWKKERNLFNPGSTTNPDSSKVHHY